MRSKFLFSSLLFNIPATLAAANCTASYFASIIPENATVRFARSVQNGSTFEVPEGDIAYPTSPAGVKAACAVEVNVTSSPTSAYSFGLFLPEPGSWNQRFLATGNGGFAGGINWLDMAAGLGYGFSTMSTDTGHNSTSGDIEWALNNPERRADWGYRAMHGSVVLAKEITDKYYGKCPEYSYYSGCSTGGRQGIRELQLHPDSFDGVLAGAPAWWASHLQTWSAKVGLFNLPATAAHHIPPTLFPMIAAEVLKQCDPQDGLADNIISDPYGCNFYPEALLCNANATTTNASAACLTAPQIDTMNKIHGNYVETNDTFVFPGLTLGSEAQWEFLLGADEPSSYGSQYVQNMVLDDASWSVWDFNGTIVELADEHRPGNATADVYDLTPFHERGGKLIHYHGEADGLIPTGSSVYFYKQVLQTMVPKGVPLDDWYRFFLVPGMQHCAGTPSDVDAPWYIAGGNQAGDLGTPGSVHGVPGFADGRHDALLALMDWVEKDRAPQQIIATKFQNETTPNEVQRQRPLCPYPKKAQYSGKGNPDEPDNWSCGLLYDPSASYKKPEIPMLGG